MNNLKATVIMKTDLVNFTGRVASSSEADLSGILRVQKDLINGVVSKNNGKVIKGEGDSFWVVYPSVTMAAISAVEIQQEFRVEQAGLSDTDALSIRIAITIGDVLHQEGDIFGDAVNLAARIEAITPPDEIYLSHAAWLVLNKAEIGNSYVDKFDLKGMSSKERIYRIDQQHKTRIIRGQTAIFTDLRNFSGFKNEYSIEDVENVIAKMEEVARAACDSNGGTIRATIGDAHFMTFANAEAAIKGILKILTEWDVFLKETGYPTFTALGAHIADVYIFRSCIYGEQINKAALIESLCRSAHPELDRSVALISNQIYDEVADMKFDCEFKKVDPSVIDRRMQSRYQKRFSEGESLFEIMVSNNESNTRLRSPLHQK